MAYTQDQIDALEAAIAIGATKVKHGQQEVQYRSISDMQKLLAQMKQSLGLTTKGSRTIIGACRR